VILQILIDDVSPAAVLTVVRREIAAAVRRREDDLASMLRTPGMSLACQDLARAQLTKAMLELARFDDFMMSNDMRPDHAG